MLILTEIQIAHFWERVDKSGDCWLWTGTMFKSGYGLISINDKSTYTHRLAYTISTGNDPGKYLILHSCDNPPCCNPAHLRKGTHAENMADMVSGHRGAKHIDSSPKLTQELADNLREDYKLSQNKSKLSKKYNISCTHVTDILNNKYWKI